MQTTIFILNDKWQQRLLGLKNFIFFLGVLALLSIIAGLFILLCKIVSAAVDAVWNVFLPIASAYQHADTLMRAVMLIGFGLALAGLLWVMLPKVYRFAQRVMPAIQAWL